MDVLCIGIPSYDGQNSSRLGAALMNEARLPDVPRFTVAHKSSSLLAFSFNQLWCTALNNRHLFSHFLMIHADIVPQKTGWLKQILAEMERVGADVLSATVPLKDEKGLTSTALLPDLTSAHRLGEKRARRRRLALRELENFPQTFDARAAVNALGLAAEYKKPALLVNTGFMLVDLRRAWVEEAFFTINDCVWKRADGKFACDVEPEDWFFSVRAAQLGAKVFATRSIALHHLGIMPFPNEGNWGTWSFDETIYMETETDEKKELA